MSMMMPVISGCSRKFYIWHQCLTNGFKNRRKKNQGSLSKLGTYRTSRAKI